MTPLSVRNNNPGNLRPVGSTGGFRSFASPEEGLEAMRRDLLLKISGQSPAMQGNFGEGYQPTLSNLISTWAPPNENDTQNYINLVSQKTGLMPDSLVTEEHLDPLVMAMIEQEGGQPAVEYFGGEAPLTPEEEAELAALEAQTTEAPLTPEEEAELAALEAGEITPPPAPQLTPAQEFSNEHPIVRTLGRTGRNATIGLASVGDLGLLVPKTAALGVGLGAEKMGAEGLGRALQELGATPTLSSVAENSIDSLTGGKLKPVNKTEEWFDMLAQIISSSIPFAKGPQALSALAPKPPTIGTTLKSVLDPETALNQLPAIQKAQSIPRLTSDTVRKAASATYQKASELGGILKPQATDSFLDNVAKEVMPQTAAGRVVAGADTPVAKVMQRLEGLRGQPLSLDEVQEIDEILGEAIDGEFGIKGLSKQGKKILDIQNSFRDMIENADESMVAGTKKGFEALKEGRALWAKNMKMRDIERIMTRAEMSDQPANAMRAGFKTLYNNPNRIKGFSDAEKELIRQGAKDNLPMELLRGLASRLTGIVSASVHGPAGYAAGKGVEMGARGIREAMANQKAQAILDLISGYKPKNSTPLLTNQGALATLAGTNTAGQNMLSRPPLQITVRPELRAR